MEATREGDLCLPRSQAIIRHGAEPPAPGWLAEARISVRNGIKIYGWWAYLFIGWILFNGLVSGWLVWYIVQRVFGLGTSLSLACSISAGLFYGGLWAMQGSMAAQGEAGIARRLRYRLGGVSLLLIAGLALYLTIS